MRFTLPKYTLIVSFSLLFAFACQEDATSELQIEEEAEVMDEDMIAATKLVDDYLGLSRGISSGNNPITVLRYVNGQLMYNTNTDTIDYYQPITETTVTASIEPGQNVFWYSGMGLSDLNEIEFDDASEEVLEDDPEEVYEDVMWTVILPDEPDTTQQFLKYDIIYQFEGNTGAPIRLDPKLKINQ